MKKSFLRLTCLTALLVFAVMSDSPTANSANTDYFDDFYACDNAYYPTLLTCRQNPNYPNDPDEYDCRYTAGVDFQTCISTLYPTTPEPVDFCAKAREARDYCVGMYGGGGADPDLAAYSACYNGSAISQCE
jgi:hypothetical protein